ncbi:MAG: NAD(P)/FAD-dependent oxidoreductase [Thermoplasmata archaeon]
MEEADVVVIGAGFSGLAAAEQLTVANRRVVLLEASDRVGGRARTDYHLAEGVPLELGAQMIHGREAVTHTWISREGLRSRPLPVSQRGRIVVGRRVARFPWFALPFHPVAGTRAIYDGFVRLPRQIDAAVPPDRSLEEFLGERKVRPAARLIVSNLYAHVYAADPEAIGVMGPAEEYRQAREPYGFRNFQLVEGYSALVERVAGRLGNRVRLKHVVTDVHVESSGVRVRADSAEGTSREYHAAGVIVTVPLGVLKAGSIEFDPPLSDEKLAAIQRIAFGDVYALQLRIKGGTMRRRLGDFGLVWGGTPSAFYRPRVALRETAEFVTAFTVGREARRRAALPDDELIRATVAEWNGLLPANVTLGKVEGYVVHRWPTDPWVRGGYSYLPPGVGLTERRALAAPIGGRIFFAGEATDVAGQSGTVAGAIDTGTRAAEEYLATLRASGT